MLLLAKEMSPFSSSLTFYLSRIHRTHSSVTAVLHYLVGNVVEFPAINRMYENNDNLGKCYHEGLILIL